MLDQATHAGRKAAMRRLKKILALSRSSTPGEAAAALHQAQTIMATFGITDDDLAFAEVKEASIKLSSCDPAVWESALVEVVYKSLGVQALCQKMRPTPGVIRDRAHVVFVGDGCRAEIAGKSKLAALMESPSSISVAQYCESRLTTSAPEKTKRVGAPRCSHGGDPIAAYMAIQGMRDGKGAVLHRGLHSSGPVLAIN